MICLAFKYLFKTQKAAAGMEISSEGFQSVPAARAALIPPVQVILLSKSLHLDKSGFRRSKRNCCKLPIRRLSTCFIMISGLVYFTVFKITKSHLSHNKYI